MSTLVISHGHKPLDKFLLKVNKTHSLISHWPQFRPLKNINYVAVVTACLTTVFFFQGTVEIFLETPVRLPLLNTQDSILQIVTTGNSMWICDHRWFNVNGNSMWICGHRPLSVNVWTQVTECECVNTGDSVWMFEHRWLNVNMWTQVT